MSTVPRSAAWKSAVEAGLASEFCDRIVATRPAPPRLLLAIFGGTPSFTDEQREALLTSRPEPLSLTPRDCEILALFAAGRRVKDVADTLGISPQTVATHLRQSAKRMGTHCVTGTVAAAIRRGLIT